MPNGSRLAITATTGALVALASIGTGVLVLNGARQLNPPSHQGALPPTPAPPDRHAPVVVARPPGSPVVPPAKPHPAAPVVHTVIVPAAAQVAPPPVTPSSSPSESPKPAPSPTPPPAPVPTPAGSPPPSGGPGHGHHPKTHDDEGNHYGQLKHPR